MHKLSRSSLTLSGNRLDKNRRDLTLNDFGGNFSFSGTWKETYIRSLLCKSKGPDAAIEFYGHEPIEIDHCYSQVLYDPWLKAAGLPINPRWLDIDNVERRSGLTRDSFVAEFAERRLPVILTDVIPNWPAFENWKADKLRERCGDTVFRVSASIDQNLNDYLQYVQNCGGSGDERPLYLFEKDFFKKVPGSEAEFSIPEPFAEDLMQVLGPERRPDYRWLIMGPARSGSSFHVDPNCNFAWNACIQGRKKWVLYPPHVQPPGLDDDTVSLVEWFHRYYDDDEYSADRLECVTGPGELMFVPRGWWHCVLNLEFCVALTHNVVCEHNLLDAVDFLSQADICEPGTGCRGDVAINLSGDVPTSVIFPYKSKLRQGGNNDTNKICEESAESPALCECISHKRKLEADFIQALEEKRPGLLDRLRNERAAKKASKQSLWDKLGLNEPGAKEESSSFSFGF